MLTGGGYDQNVDLWALGILIFKIITKTTPFESVYHSDTVNKISKSEVTFDN
jgi:serine/threonine protein kinase